MLRSDMIALSHKTRFSHVVHLSNEESASTLFDLAKPGDTLHNVVVPDDNVEELMNQIGSNLINGRFQKI